MEHKVVEEITFCILENIFWLNEEWCRANILGLVVENFIKSAVFPVPYAFERVQALITIE